MNNCLDSCRPVAAGFGEQHYQGRFYAHPEGFRLPAGVQNLSGPTLVSLPRFVSLLASKG